MRCTSYLFYQPLLLVEILDKLMSIKATSS
jgi:hypothetical protein